MKLYKYKSLSNLWHTLDIIVNQRLYCAPWRDLNDPLEGRYELYADDRSARARANMHRTIKQARDSYRIASLSADPTNFLMWSHYADGHKGVVIEVEIPDEQDELDEVIYSPFNIVIGDGFEEDTDFRDIFRAKTQEWEYEREYRIITQDQYFELEQPVTRLLLGPSVKEDQETILRRLIPASVEIVKMELDRTQGTITINDHQKSMHPTRRSSRFSLST